MIFAHKFFYAMAGCVVSSLIFGCSLMPTVRHDAAKYNRESRSVELAEFGWLNYEKNDKLSRIVYAKNYTCKLLRKENESYYLNFLRKKLITRLSRIPVERIVINELKIDNSSPIVTIAYLDYCVGDDMSRGKLIFCFSLMYSEWFAVYSNANASP